MKHLAPIFLLIAFVTLCSCNGTDSSDTDPDAGDTDTSEGKTIYTCRYDNKFAGPDCKEYIGSNWDDPTAREEDCGAGFVEENAKIVEGACPAKVADEGTDKPKKGVSPEQTAKLAHLYTLPIQKLRARDFREGAFRGGSNPEDLYRRVYIGIKGTPMPATGPQPGADGVFTSDEIWDVVHYILSLTGE